MKLTRAADRCHEPSRRGSAVLLCALFVIVEFAFSACVPPTIYDPSTDSETDDAGAAYGLGFSSPTPPDGSFVGNQTQTIAGICVPGISVAFAGDVDSPASTTCSTAGKFSTSVTFSAGDGAKTVTISQTDADDETTSRSRSFVLDDTDPVFAQTVTEADSDFSSVTQSPSISRSGDATDVGGSGVSHYEYAVGTSAGDTDVVSWSVALTHPFVIDFAPSTLTEGETYYVTMRAVDSAGNHSIAVNSAGWTVDVTDPPLSFSGDTPDDDEVVNSGTITIEGDCETGLPITIAGDVDSPLAAACVGAEFSETLTLSAGDGIKSYSVSQTDAAANTSIDARNVTVDTAAPAFVATLDEASAAFNSLSATPEITWSADATDVGGSGVSHYEYAIGTTQGDTDVVDWTSVPNGADNPFEVTGISPDLGDGLTYFVSVRAVDSAGNFSASVESDGWTADVTAPALSYGGATPADESAVTTSTITIEGACETGIDVEILGDVDSPANTACAAGAFSETVTFSAGDSTKAVTIRQEDAAGNETTETRTYEVDTVEPEVVLIAAAVDDGTYVPGQTVSIDVTFSEAVTVAGGTPHIALNTGGQANFADGSGTNTLQFDYVIGAGETASALEYDTATPVSLNGATIRDAAGNDADLTFPTPGDPGSLAVEHELRIFPGFDAGTQIHAVTDAMAVRAEDLNKDGHTDFIVGYAGGQNLVYFGDGLGGFGAPVGIGAGGDAYQTRDLALIDLNRDGELDLVEANEGQENRYYLNAGGGVFSSAGVAIEFDVEGVPTTVADASMAVGVGDFNRDGWNDIVFGNADGEPNSVYLVTSGPVFSLAASLDADDTRGLWVADFNRDGRQDIVTANFGSPNAIYLGSGDGSFSSQAVHVDESADSTSVIAADFNHDGVLDLVFGNSGEADIHLTGIGNGQFLEPSELASTSLDTRSLAVEDLDHDGAPDVVIGTAGEGTYGCLGRSDGTFGPLFQIAPAETPLAEALTLKDVDHDGRLDLFVAASDDSQRLYLGVLDWSPLLSFTESILSDDIQTTESAYIADYNRDGRPDLLTGNTVFSEQATLYRAHASGHFAAPELLGVGTAGGMIVADIDLDSDPDLILLQDSNLRYLRNNGAGGFNTSITISTEAGDTSAAAVGDLNRDGFPDVVRANTDGPSRVYLGTALGAFDTGSDVSAATQDVTAVLLRDVNGDGVLDLILAIEGSETLIHLGDGAGGFVAADPIGSAQAARAIALADLNQDGNLDLIQVNDGEEDLIYLGDGTGAFGAGTAIEAAVEDDSTAVSVGDLNRDGALDLVVTTLSSGTHVYLGDGTGAFSLLGSLEEDAPASSVVIGDLNRDGAPDIFIGTQGQENLIYLND